MVGDVASPVVFGDALAVDLATRLRKAKDLGITTDDELRAVINQLKYCDAQIEAAKREQQVLTGKIQAFGAMKISISSHFGDRILSHELQLRQAAQVRAGDPTTPSTPNPGDTGTPTPPPETPEAPTKRTKKTRKPVEG